MMGEGRFANGRRRMRIGKKRFSRELQEFDRRQNEEMLSKNHSQPTTLRS